MAEQQNFRITFNGFNRDDVVRYIEQVNAKHSAEVIRLNTDIQYLQEKLAQCEVNASEQPDTSAMEQQMAEQAQRIAALEAELAKAREDARTAETLLTEAESENSRLQNRLTEAEGENTRLQALLDTALSRQSGARTQEAAELSAYRRAERVERQAKQRAAEICEQASGVLADATARVDETAAQLAAMAEDTMRQVRQLQLAVTGSKQVLQDAAATLFTIRPAAEEE